MKNCRLGWKNVLPVWKNTFIKDDIVNNKEEIIILQTNLANNKEDIEKNDEKIDSLSDEAQYIY